MYHSDLRFEGKLHLRQLLCRIVGASECLHLFDLFNRYGLLPKPSFIFFEWRVGDRTQERVEILGKPPGQYFHFFIVILKT